MISWCCFSRNDSQEACAWNALRLPMFQRNPYRLSDGSAPQDTRPSSIRARGRRLEKEVNVPTELRQYDLLPKENSIPHGVESRYESARRVPAGGWTFRCFAM